MSYSLKGKKVLVTGGHGFLGHHLVAELEKYEVSSLIVTRKKDYDLTQETEVKRLFDDVKPDVVFHLAGLVGGILPNKERPAEYFYQNLMMGTLMLNYSYLSGVEKFIAAGAGCGYPEGAKLPLKESSFWSGFPQKESAPYSLAKRLLTIQSEAYFRQYGFVSIICVPGNLYGPWDNFNLHDSHVIPALVRKFVEAKERRSASVEIWGTGKASRDFVYAGDVSRGLIEAVCHYEHSEVVNISSGVETSIQRVCELLKEITDFDGELVWDREKPDGQLRRCFDISKAQRDLNYVAKVSIQEGLEQTVLWYKKNHHLEEVRK